MGILAGSHFGDHFVKGNEHMVQNLIRVGMQFSRRNKFLRQADA